MSTARRAELAQNLAVVTDRITAACAAARRAPDGVTIVAITKTWPASDVELLAELGIRHVGRTATRRRARRPRRALGWG